MINKNQLRKNQLKRKKNTKEESFWYRADRRNPSQDVSYSAGTSYGCGYNDEQKLL